MPLSSNAPFNEFGQSMILRDIEQLYLLIGGGQNPTPGSVGEGASQESQTQLDQTTSGGGGPTSPVATLSDLANAIANNRTTFPISVSSGGTGSVSAITALRALGGVNGRGSTLVNATGANTFTVPSGVNRLQIMLIGAKGGTGGSQSIAQDIVAYASSTNGGATNLAIGVTAKGQLGSEGAFALCQIDVNPGDTISYTVGATGADGSSAGAGTNGSNGGSTSITYGALVITAGGGIGGNKASSVANAAIFPAAGVGVSVTGASLATFNGWIWGIKSSYAPITHPLISDAGGNLYPSQAISYTSAYQLGNATTTTTVGGGLSAADGALLFLY